jgi:hypothetical protein
MHTGWLLMSQARNRWIYGSIFLTLLIAIAIIPLEPVTGISFTLLSLLIVGAAYIRATKRPSIPPISPTRSTSMLEKATSLDREDLVRDSELVRVHVLEEESKEVQPSQEPSQETSSKPEMANAGTEEKLRQRIVKLEKRVQSLQQQLTEESLSEIETVTPLDEPVEPITSEPPPDDLELSELAIEHILEALDEKLAKGSITKPLYDRLRDKYIARMEKAKKRHKAPSTRGTKEPLTGE